MTAVDYRPPDNPADPEAAALEMIVAFPAVLAEPGRLMHPLIEAMQDYTGLLAAAGAFAGMVWPDARQVAAAVAFDACMRDDAAAMMRERAASALSGADGMVWRDRDAVVRAFTLAAEALGGDGMGP